MTTTKKSQATRRLGVIANEGLVAKAKPPNSRFRLPRIRTPADLPKLLSAVERAVASGQASAQEGLSLAEIIERQRRAFETTEFDQRLRALEQR